MVFDESDDYPPVAQELRIFTWSRVPHLRAVFFGAKVGSRTPPPEVLLSFRSLFFEPSTPTQSRRLPPHRARNAESCSTANLRAFRTVRV